jgi:hypothetical protein
MIPCLIVTSECTRCSRQHHLQGYVSRFFTVDGMDGQASGVSVNRILCPPLWNLRRINGQSHFARRTCVMSLSRMLVRMVKSGGFFCILLLIPGLSYPSIISKGQSRETVTSEAFTAGEGASGAIDATASHVFPNPGPIDAADTQIPGERRFDEHQPSLTQKVANYPAHHEMSSLYLLVIVMIFALFIELTGNRFR